MIDNTVKNPNNIKRDFSTLSKEEKIENSDSPTHNDLNKIEKKIKIEQKVYFFFNHLKKKKNK